MGFFCIKFESRPLFYDQRYAVERTNASMDSFRPLLNRFYTTIESWKGFNYLTFYRIVPEKFQIKKV
ncbi:hypothetical protein [Flagellimonas abyssi]|uniref:Uncharacterized protein n=1 Tax=Flagellimonas abyssi TaxID=2864871 RepID=A0ABS7EPE4_9FLAO|nr:hypothetical protein [Allomuricauda abyssi]MBW8199452.1 hypothetical protein [Allomuricauda abyssi]